MSKLTFLSIKVNYGAIVITTFGAIKTLRVFSKST